MLLYLRWYRVILVSICDLEQLIDNGSIGDPKLVKEEVAQMRIRVADDCLGPHRPH